MSCCDTDESSVIFSSTVLLLSCLLGVVLVTVLPGRSIIILEGSIDSTISINCPSTWFSISLVLLYKEKSAIGKYSPRCSKPPWFQLSLGLNTFSNLSIVNLLEFAVESAGSVFFNGLNKLLATCLNPFLVLRLTLSMLLDTASLFIAFCAGPDPCSWPCSSLPSNLSISKASRACIACGNILELPVSCTLAVISSCICSSVLLPGTKKSWNSTDP